MPPLKSSKSQKGYHAKPTTKKSKSFLEDKDVALEIANSVAAAQEDKSLKKVERHLQTQNSSTASGTKRVVSTGSKAKLKQVKAALASEAARAKREKAKKRKEAKTTKFDSGDSPVLPEQNSKSKPQNRKRVCFA
ncbi:hypothetical protein AcW1_005210 [Taiwanofungus camphoratus]|nr:hypothetical protein AcW2_003980 [Antrodia cinnamomea]KAI0933375.1 hypothetical protein AcV5_005534 [Antrodia cinnamomea]KAI0948840.1 hypothetical protein AcV7_009476 [Antrodia cinnamomea]KAI0956562.1 hypothetical protein AcW1_005210 [Antrodia cinnamomea]